MARPDAAPAAGPAPDPGPPQALLPVRHTWVEDLLALLVGTYLASLGIFFLAGGGVVTGGTAGLSLLVTYASGWPFGVLFVLFNIPFLVLGAWKRGIAFGMRTVAAIVLVGLGSELHPLMLPPVDLPALYGALTGSVLAGVGMLIVFRHNASMGGLNTLALLAQDLWGWRAGYVQLSFDVVIILAALTVASPAIVAASALGAVLLNLVLVLNHRPGRYLGG